ncbi:hypothetical protein WR25_15537 [Diploscapter pachys]|uniref:Potassium channel domain-containing protein n=1 Tax=Diploscapter pachys TaxID=2018661 RepID=A0A2A2JHW3_9BILA|nr:hypothetical protein WR25_15537 [Diploscapter pachys]
MARRHRRSKVRRVVNLVKKIIAFFFSHIGLCALVIGYAMLGAVIFKKVEGIHERQVQFVVKSARERAVDVIWNATFNVNRLDAKQWQATVLKEVMEFKHVTVKMIREGFDGKEYDVNQQWTYPGAFMYSLTIITTIGYGNTSAKTNIGKVITMLYAVIGIPLMLLFLTNIGDVMAKIFRFLYAQSIRLKFRLILWHKRRKAAKIRRANSLVSRLTRGHRVKADSSIDSFGLGGPDVEDLLTARVEMEQLEVKETAQATLERITVPLSLVILTMVAYLGAGFGDKFPGKSVAEEDSQKKLIITSIYLIFGMALLAMCLNLAQEQVQNKTKWIANKFKSKDDEDD